MTDPLERIVVGELESEDRHRTRREHGIVAAILVIGVALALLVGYEITSTDIGYKSIRCEEGDVTLVLTKADGTIERVECPAVVPVKE